MGEVVKFQSRGWKNYGRWLKEATRLAREHRLQQEQAAAETDRSHDTHPKPDTADH